MLRACSLAILALSLAGCGPSSRNSGTEKGTGPVGSLTRAEAQIEAEAAAERLGPDAYATALLSTGSMEPVFNSYAFVVWEPCDGSDIVPYQIVAYEVPGRIGFIAHSVSTAISPNAFIPTGGANSTSDGWVPRASVRYRVASVHYSNAPNPETVP